MFCSSLYSALSQYTRKIYRHSSVLKFRYNNIQMHCSEHNTTAESKLCFPKTKGHSFKKQVIY